MSEQNAVAIAELMDGLGIQDPRLRQLLQQRLERGAARSPKGSRAAARRSRARHDQALIEAVLGKLEVLACALGACPSCWGEDPDCKECGGAGRCGAFLPDMHCFTTYVGPVIRLLLEQQAPDAARPPAPQPQPVLKREETS